MDSPGFRRLLLTERILFYVWLGKTRHRNGIWTSKQVRLSKGIVFLPLLLKEGIKGWLKEGKNRKVFPSLLYQAPTFMVGWKRGMNPRATL